MAYMPFYSLLASSASGFALLIAICIGEARRVKQHWLGCDGSFSHHEAVAPEDASDIPCSGRHVSACAFLHLFTGEEGQALEISGYSEIPGKPAFDRVALGVLGKLHSHPFSAGICER